MKGTILLAIIVATACMAQTPPPQSAAPMRTIIRDRAAFDRLIGNDGLTLQWIDWATRGNLSVDYRGDLLRLHGEQRASGAAGHLSLDGVVTQVDADRFTFRGRIVIHDTPDVGRMCVRDGDMIFAITQNRQYWRLQQMEACDGLTDYVDIYF